MQTQAHANATPATPVQVLRAILVVDEEPGLREALSVLLKRSGFEPTAVGSATAAHAELARRPFDLVFSSIDLMKDAAFADRLRACDAALVFLSDSFDEGLRAMKRGAYDHAHKPIRADEIALVLRNAEERLHLLREHRAHVKLAIAHAKDDAAHDRALIGESPKMAELYRTIRKVAEHKTTVLITGESGTGKELVARAIHAASPRKDAPFVAVNCGAIPEALLESELFGHKKGAFTDAVRDKRGLFSEASGGTLFLDEIGEMPLAPQVKLLRVLQEQQVRPVGSVEDEAVDVRVIAATMRDLSADVAGGRFREDLYYRLNVIQVALPALRDRREDLATLVTHFLARTNHKLGTHVRAVAPEAMKLFASYAWPGNVRELENTIERSVVLCDGDTLTADGLPERFSAPNDPVREALGSGELSIKKTTRVIEEELIRRALAATGGNRTNASKILEISHRALLYKMKEFKVVDRPVRAAKTLRGEKFDREG